MMHKGLTRTSCCLVFRQSTDAARHKHATVAMTRTGESNWAPLGVRHRLLLHPAVLQYRRLEMHPFRAEREGQCTVPSTRLHRGSWTAWRLFLRHCQMSERGSGLPLQPSQVPPELIGVPLAYRLR